MDKHDNNINRIWPVAAGILLGLMVLVIAIAVVAGLAIVTVRSEGPGGVGGKSLLQKWLSKEEKEITIVSESRLTDILNASEMSVVSVDYSAIARKYDDSERTLQYCVSYNGTVNLGIDFSQIEIETRDSYMDGEDTLECRVFIVHIPECEILDENVDFGSMDYIFAEQSAETETVSTQAYELCRKDLSQRVRNDKELKNLAKRSVIDAVNALLAPWMEQVDDRCEIQIEYGSKYAE